MKHNIATALLELAPGAEWTLVDDEYASINWIKGNGYNKPDETVLKDKIAALDAAEPMKLLRQERNSRLVKSDWRAGQDATLSTDWRNYRQALRDLPASVTPKLDSSYELDLESVTWPTEPS